MILRKGLLTTLIQFVQLVALIGTTILVTRVTGAHGRGVYTLVSSVAILASMITALGISWAGIYYIGKRLFPLADVASTVLTVSMVSGGVAVAGVAAVYLLFQHSYFHELSTTQAFIMLALTALFQVTTASASIVLGMNRPVSYASVSLTQWAVSFAIQVGFGITGSLTATSALLALAIGAAISSGFGLVLVRREVPLRLSVDMKILRSFLNFGIRGYAADLMMFLNYRLDSLIVNGLIGVLSLGYYSVSAAMAETLLYGANGFALVMFPHVSSLERKEADRITPVVCRNVVFMSLIGAVVMFAVSHQLILFIFGSGMTPALHPLWLLLPGIVSLTAVRVIASYLSGIGKPIYSTYTAAGAVILTVGLDLVLIPRYGISGAAAASSIVYTCTAVASVWIFKFESGAGLLETLVVGPDDFVRYRRLLATMRRRFAASPARS